MPSPFQQALLALEIAVDALHGVSKESREARLSAEDAFAQIAHLGFDTRSPDERQSPPDSFAAKESSRQRGRPRKGRQKTLFE